jgi:hypothetical protein
MAEEHKGHEGSFGSGEEETEHHPERDKGDFAEGGEEHGHRHEGSFAEGVEETEHHPEREGRGTFAEGEETG